MMVPYQLSNQLPRPIVLAGKKILRPGLQLIPSFFVPL